MDIIVFGNLYFKDGFKRFNIIGLYKEGQIEPLSKETKLDLFPNNGRIFVPQDYTAQNVLVSGSVKYGLYKVEESPTYEPDKENSLKYSLGPEVKNVKLCEVVQINKASDAGDLHKRFQEGWHFPYEPLPNVLFYTSDDRLIGPLQLKPRGNSDIWDIYDPDGDYFVPCYDNNAKFFYYKNNYLGEPERIFTVIEDLGPAIDYIDIADDEWAIRNVLKILRENAKIGELSRRTIQQLSNFCNNGYITESQRIKRVQRVIQLLKAHTFEEEILQEIQKELFELPYMQSYIEQQLKLQKQEYEKQLDNEHRSLLNQIKQLKDESKRLNQELSSKRKEKDILEETLHQLQSKKEEKLHEIQSDVVDVFVNQLLMRGLAFSEVASASLFPSHSVGTTLYALKMDRQVPVYHKLEDFEYCLSKCVHVNECRWLTQTVLGALLFDTPIIIVGMRAMELALLLAQCAAANDMLMILPEIHSFSLDGLTGQFEKYHRSRNVKALILHNPHFSSAESSLPAFLRFKRWIGVSNVPDLVLISMDPMDNMAEDFIRKFPTSPILNTEELLSMKKISQPFVPPESCGQLTWPLLDELREIAVQDSHEIRDAFVDWVLENERIMLDNCPKEFDDWLGLFILVSGNQNQNEQFRWMWQIFHHHLKRLNEKEGG